jgi:hypothetical protein
MAFAFIHEWKNPSLLKFSAIPCNLEYCEDVFDSAKELEKHSPVLMEAARNYSEVAHCIKTQNIMMYQILCGHVNYALGKTRMQVKKKKINLLKILKSFCQ